MNTEYRMKAKNDFEKDLYKLMNNAVFDKTMENVRKHRDINLVINDTKRNKLVSEPNYHTKKWFSGNLLAIEIRHFIQATKNRIFKNLNLRKKAGRNFRGNLLKNHFRHLKLYSNSS